MSESGLDDSAEKYIQTAELTWDAQGQPNSRQFEDVYFSRADGLAETRHVFLHHNQLAERFAALSALPTDARHFVIGETGFGSGLNVLAAWQLWRQTAPSDATLHVISVDKYPLSREDLIRALSLWPELDDLTRQLIQQYPPVAGPGFHRLNLDGGRVKVTLIFDEACTGLIKARTSLHPAFRHQGWRVDAWFLDGFAPAKNADMWTEALFDTLAALSGSHTTLATFTAAGLVRRGLQAAGFQVNKVAGFGRKREMIVAQFAPAANAPTTPHRLPRRPPLPWAIPSTKSRHPAAAPRTAMVIGAGLAGCHSARSLAHRGWRVTVLERNPAPATEASGNPQGLLYAKLSAQDSPLSRWNLVSLCYAQRHYTDFWQQTPASGEHFGAACGLLQVPSNDREQRQQAAIAQRFAAAPDLLIPMTAEEASARADVPLASGGLFFPGAGWLNPPAICRALLNHPNIQVITGVDVHALTHEHNQWQARDSQGHRLADTTVAVLANAYAASRFVEALPLKAIRGQISQVPSTAVTSTLATALCSEGYIAPAHEERHCVGATFDLHETHTDVTAEGHRANLKQLSVFGEVLGSSWINPDIGTIDIETIDIETWKGRVGFRCATADYLPLIGPVPDREVMREDYADLRRDARLNIPLPGQYQPGLYLNVGYGSRGLCYTPLGAELLASHIDGEPPPVDRELLESLHPARFLIRALMRNQC